MSNIAPVSFIKGPQHAYPVSSKLTVILFGLALLITACTDGGNVTVSNGGAVTPAPTPAPAPTPTPVPPPPPTSLSRWPKPGLAPLPPAPAASPAAQPAATVTLAIPM